MRLCCWRLYTGQQHKTVGFRGQLRIKVASTEENAKFEEKDTITRSQKKWNLNLEMGPNRSWPHSSVKAETFSYFQCDSIKHALLHPLSYLSCFNRPDLFLIFQLFFSLHLQSGHTDETHHLHYLKWNKNQ